MSLTLAENVIVAGADNRPPMLDKTNYSSWASQPGNENTPATIRARTYTDLTDEEKIRESVDIKATNIVLQGLPQDIYNLVNYNEHAKQIWDRVKLLIQGSELSLQEYVKLAKDIHTTNFDHLYAHLRQHEAHANEVRLTRQRYLNQTVLVANSSSCLNLTRYYPQLSPTTQQYYSPPTPQSPALQQSYQAHVIQQPSQPSFPELDSGLVVPSFNPSDDPIASLNKAMAFLSIAFASRFLQTNNKLRNSSNHRNQATIQDGRVTVQIAQGRQTQGYDNTGARNNATNQGVYRNARANTPGQARVDKCYNYQEEAYNGDTITPVQASQEIPSPAAFQMNDLDAFDSDCDDAPSAKAVLMANLSSYDPNVISEQHDALFVPDTEETLDLAEENKKYFEIEKKELNLDSDHLLEHIICQDVMNIVMHANVHSHIVLPANNNSLEHLKHENDRLMKLLISQDLVHTAVNSLVAINDYKNMQQSFVDEYNETLVLKAELAKKHDMIEKVVYNELSKRCSRLENRCISLEIKLQQSKESFQTNRPSHNQDAPEFKEFFIINELQAQLKAKNVSIEKLKEHIANIKGKNVVDSVQNVHNSNVSVMKIVKHSVLNANSNFICATCLECMFDAIHDLCVHDYLNDVNARVKSKSVKSRLAKSKKKKMWKPTGKVYTNVGYSWKPTGRIFTIDGNTCPLTKIISTKVVQIILWYLDSGCSKHMTGQRSQLINFVSKFLATVRFCNDQITKIMGYGDYQLGNVTISRVYYVEGFRHNLFSVGQFCDSDLEVGFRKHTCYVRNLEGADLLSRSRDTNFYTISLDDMLKSSPICFLSKASKTKSWLWHQRLSYLNFATLNQLAKQGLVRGLAKLKFEKNQHKFRQFF
ncbi:integrase, catalytic region, zinc finger, CCHC-type containing protein [Tanacetum coccineum]